MASMEQILTPEQKQYEQALINITQEIEQDGHAVTRFVTDDDKADWAFKQLSNLAADHARDQAYVDRNIKPYLDWLAKRDTKRKSFRDFLQLDLMTYALDKRRDDPKYKLSLPHGKGTFRRAKPKPVVKDDQAVLDWIANNWPADRAKDAIKQEPRKSVLNKYMTPAGDKVVDDNGQIVEGMGVDSGHDSVTLKPLEEDNN